MNPKGSFASVPTSEEGSKPRRLDWRAVVAVIASVLAGGLSVLLGGSLASSAFIDMGPTDGAYVTGFRDIERDGDIYFRWTSVPSSTIRFPAAVCGEGTLRMRLRRHFVDPALLKVSVNGRVVGEVSVQAGSDLPYRVVEFPFSSAICAQNVSVLLESSVTNDRPIGVALDWVQLQSTALRPSWATVLRAGVLAGLLALVLILAGASTLTLSATLGAVTLLVALGFGADPISAERILRGGLAAFFVTLAVGLLLVRTTRLRGLSSRSHVGLILATLVALIARSAFLHDQAFYPDYRVHGLVQQTFNRLGPGRFLDQLFEIQYARSLGLQQIEERWYPFPYPPGAYAIAGGLSAAGLDALDAITATAVAAGALLPLMTVAFGLALGLSEFAGLAGAFVIAIHPLLIRRMALGYFPSLISQVMDAVALLIIIELIRRIAGPRLLPLAALSAVLLGGFLTYTQSIANFGLLIGGMIIGGLALRTTQALGRASQIGAAAALALVLSFGLFYSRYLPVFENIEAHQAQPESKVLDRLDDLRRNASVSDLAEGDLNDPYAGSTLNPARGLARLGSRLWRFNGFFVVGILVGGWLILRTLSAEFRPLFLAWAAVAVWISLLAAGLPSPNGFQHLKDLEFTTPLAALCLGVVAERAKNWNRLGLICLATLWTAFAAHAFWVEWTQRLIRVSGV